jgi:hypothetical protein
MSVFSFTLGKIWNIVESSDEDPGLSSHALCPPVRVTSDRLGDYMSLGFSPVIEKNDMTT